MPIKIYFDLSTDKRERKADERKVVVEKTRENSDSENDSDTGLYGKNYENDVCIILLSFYLSIDKIDK